MNQNSHHETGRDDILRRLDAIEARVATASRRACSLCSETDTPLERTLPGGDSVSRLDSIEANLAALEDHLKQLETQMREKESPPESFGTSSEFSTGPPY